MLPRPLCALSRARRPGDRDHTRAHPVTDALEAAATTRGILAGRYVTWPRVGPQEPALRPGPARSSRHRRRAARCTPSADNELARSFSATLGREAPTRLPVRPTRLPSRRDVLGRGARPRQVHYAGRSESASCCQAFTGRPAPEAVA